MFNSNISYWRASPLIVIIVWWDKTSGASAKQQYVPWLGAPKRRYEKINNNKNINCHYPKEQIISEEQTTTTGRVLGHRRPIYYEVAAAACRWDRFFFKPLRARMTRLKRS